MTPEFVKLVTEMRSYQRQYFEAHKKGLHKAAVELLRQAKALERQVDSAIEELTGILSDNQIKMF